MLLMSVAALLLAGCKKIPPPTPLSELNPEQAAGHAVFQSRCGVCHADRDNSMMAGPALNGIFKKEYLPSGAAATDERVLATVMRGRGMMPQIGPTMTPEQIEQLMAYLHTL